MQDAIRWSRSKANSSLCMTDGGPVGKQPSPMLLVISVESIDEIVGDHMLPGLAQASQIPGRICRWSRTEISDEKLSD